MRAALMALCLLTVTAQASAAKIFRWTGPDGATHYGDQPDPDARNVEGVERRSGAPLDEAAGKTAGNARSEDAGDESEEQRSARLAECKTRRRQLASYQRATQLIEKDALGRERVYSAEDQRLLIDKTQAEIATLCVGATGEELAESPPAQ